MALPSTQAVRRGLGGCHSCRQWVLRSFIAAVGGPSMSQQPQRHGRSIASAARRQNEARERLQQIDGHPLHEINNMGRLAKQERSSLRPGQSFGEVKERNEDDEVVEATGEQLKTEHDSAAAEVEEAQIEELEQDLKEDGEAGYVPWYLQSEHQPIQQQQESPMATRQRIPGLPEHPPDVLSPLMRHVSIELGMDDLSLLDLRTLDPPPALGANLLMLIGTARSEKHLHVSADKLCRWLRTEYKIHPVADGLLGRNELKLKIRRKAKRTKLMSAVGAQATGSGELDEGIRTGWVCVNVGRVNGGELPEQKAERERREASIVGFGSSQAGCNIVVQLLTEEKRGEIDLEKLWTGILNRSKKEQEAPREAEKAAEAETELKDESTLMSELDRPGMASAVGSVQQTQREEARL